jgi:hypothetical protein
VPMCWRIFLI